jgi:hypothetical protein
LFGIKEEIIWEEESLLEECENKSSYDSIYKLIYKPIYVYNFKLSQKNKLIEKNKFFNRHIDGAFLDFRAPSKVNL